LISSVPSVAGVSLAPGPRRLVLPMSSGSPWTTCTGYRLDRDGNATGSTGEQTQRSVEIHLFVVWEHGRAVTARIVDDIRRHFTVLAAFEVEWSSGPHARHFSRLYGQSLPPDSDKVGHCGLGPYLLLVVEDEVPRYGTRRKWGRKLTVNTNRFDAKARYREWTHGHRVHNSTDEEETDRDLFVPLGLRRESFRDARRMPWDGSFRRAPPRSRRHATGRSC